VFTLLHERERKSTNDTLRYEIVPRPASLGGGWNLRLIGRDLETGQESEMGGVVLPIQDGEDAKMPIKKPTTRALIGCRPTTL